MADLTPEDIRSLARAAGLDLEEPLLTQVAYDLNAMRELLDQVNPEGLELIEPLPIIPPHLKMGHGQD